jgi:hypothetical protein
MAWVVALAACSSGGVDQIDGGGPSAVSCQGLPKTQTLSEPCCPGYGVDACGASLFCAAFDGRTQATCYAERSRPDMTGCTADIQCVSGSCNAAVQECRSLIGMPCNTQIGCAPSPNASKYVCAKGTCTFSYGKAGDPCGVDSDCQTGTCVANECVSTMGGACTNQGQCASGLCCNGMTCGPWGQGLGDNCDPFINVCQSGLICCPLSGGGGACYPSCT